SNYAASSSTVSAVLLNLQVQASESSNNRAMRTNRSSNVSGAWLQFYHQTHSLMGSDQEEIGLNLHSFRPLVQVGCSKDLKFFLCSAALPMCAPSYARPIGPCRHLCKRARRGCRPLMRKYGFDWPSMLSAVASRMLEETDCVWGPG
ncbi:hypothetical protein BOX15_Mlig010918g2, partial [Macrostomum lignano]